MLRWKDRKIRLGVPTLPPSRRRGRRARQYAEMLVLIRGLARRHKNLVTRISKAELNASFIEYELFQLLKMFEDCLEEGVDEGAGDVAAVRVWSHKQTPRGRFAILPNRVPRRWRLKHDRTATPTYVSTAASSLRFLQHSPI